MKFILRSLFLAATLFGVSAVTTSQPAKADVSVNFSVGSPAYRPYYGQRVYHRPMHRSHYYNNGYDYRWGPRPVGVRHVYVGPRCKWVQTKRWSPRRQAYVWRQVRVCR